MTPCLRDDSRTAIAPRRIHNLPFAACSSGRKRSAYRIKIIWIPAPR